MDDNVNLLSSQHDDTIEFGEEDKVAPSKTFKYPIAVTFHLLFKISAILVYLFCNIFSSSFVLTFIILIILLAADFWTTKNVSGRLLVGLRWWNYIDDEGKSHWKYESKEGKDLQTIGAAESRMFWVSMFTNQLIWILYIFTSAFRLNLKWMVVVAIANILNGANLYGYIKCRAGAGKSLKDYASGVVSRQMFSSALSSLTKSSTTTQSRQGTQVV
ncbi:uncharacterized Golgi apparatus membrane protein-like protein CG5021 [Watersipora subatra]|uniref:uncharacterized Golgi apparatus membrane protein-like protein CG5021 n=1 Tax=Watersipora subatra TaxID=2589382 RepID=UPI00355BA6B2